MKYLDLSKKALNIFNESVTKYHIIDKVDQKFNNPYSDKSLSNLLYKKKLDRYRSMAFGGYNKGSFN